MYCTASAEYTETGDTRPRAGQICKLCSAAVWMSGWDLPASQPCLYCTPHNWLASGHQRKIPSAIQCEAETDPGLSIYGDGGDGGDGQPGPAVYIVPWLSDCATAEITTCEKFCPRQQQNRTEWDTTTPVYQLGFNKCFSSTWIRIITQPETQ